MLRRRARPRQPNVPNHGERYASRIKNFSSNWILPSQPKPKGKLWTQTYWTRSGTLLPVLLW